MFHLSKLFSVLSSFMTFHRVVARLTRRVSSVEQKLLTLPEYLCSSPVFSITRSLVLYVCFVYRCLCFWAYSFGHFVVRSSSIYGFWLLLWYLQTLFIKSFFLSLIFRTKHQQKIFILLAWWFWKCDIKQQITLIILLTIWKAYIDVNCCSRLWLLWWYNLNN